MPEMEYSIIELDYDAPTQLEQLGTKAKVWFRDEQNQRLLFKEGRPGTGENWAEKVCCEIAQLLDMPHASYELATWKGRKGVITPNFVPDGGRLVFGNELLSKYIAVYNDERQYQARHHTVRSVIALTGVTKVQMPLGWVPPNSVKDAAGVFVGYLMLDALVGNQDRHDENWGLIWLPQSGVVYIAPTFDHASSLGRNESDITRNEMLNTRDKGRSIESYVARANSALFASPNDRRPLRTLDAFIEAARFRSAEADYWKSKLETIRLEEFRAILDRIPSIEISENARNFAFKMIETNRSRILAV